MSAFEKETCPYCGEKNCEAEWCDVGVGFVQCAPYHCPACNASEIGPHDGERELTEEERRTGWYAPGALSPYVSSINGAFIEQDVALEMYREGLVDTVPFQLALSEAEEKALFQKMILKRFRSVSTVESRLC